MLTVINVSIASLIRKGWRDWREYGGRGWQHPDYAGCRIWESGPYNHASVFINATEVAYENVVAQLQEWGIEFTEYSVDPNDDNHW